MSGPQKKSGSLGWKILKWTLGLVVDAVSQVMRVAEDQLQPPPPGVASVASSAVDGLFKGGDRLVIVLDVDRVLGDLDAEPDHIADGRGTPPDPGRPN